MSKVKRLIVRKEVLGLLVTTLVVLTLLFVASPTARAVSINFTSLPASGTLGSTYSFTVKVDVQNTDLLPVKSVNLEIYNVASPSYNATCTDLPAVTGTKSYTSAQTGGGAVSVSASTAANWGGASGVTRYGYGYGYGEGWKTYSDLGTGYGYGYSSGGSYVGSTSITYSVTWTPPTSWPTGTYEILILVYGDGGGKAFTTSTRPSFTLSAAPVVYGGGGGYEPEAEEGVTDLTGRITGLGVFTERVTARSEDGNVKLVIDKDTTGLTEEGRRLSEISMTEMEDPPAPPADASVIGLVYDLGPDGATFDPPVTLTFTYDPDEVPEDVAEEDLVIALWDEEAGEWVELVCVVDPETNTITAEISHFTAFSIIALAPPAPPVPPAPAEFSLSGLSVQPAEIQPKEVVAITVSVANTGGMEGAYTVVLKINGVKEAEKSVTIAADSSQMVNFSVSREEAGSYSVAVDGLSASFTVAAPLVEKPPVEEVPAKAGVNWVLIVSIVAALVVIGLIVYFLWLRRRWA